MTVASQALSKRVVRVGPWERVVDHEAAIERKRATYAVVFDAENFKGVVRLQDASVRSSHRVFCDLLSSLPEVEAGMPLVEIADNFLNPDHEAFLVKDGTRFVGLLTRESVLEHLLAEQKAIAADRESIALERSTAVKRLSEEVEARTQELVSANHELELLYHALAHDLRGPLRRIAGYCEIISEEIKSDPQKAAWYFERILSSAQVATEIVAGVQTLAEKTKKRIALSPVGVREICDRILQENHELSLKRKIKFLVTTNLPTVISHPILLHQILNNLVENALKFLGRDEGVVIIRAENVGTRTKIWVIDDGIGINPSERETIFRPFERGTNAIAIQGTGIGLAFAKMSLQQMDGAIGVESAPEQGSRFWIELPLAIEASSA